MVRLSGTDQGLIRRLTNVNVDVNDISELNASPTATPNQRTATILTMLQVESLGGVLDRPLERLEGLHIDLKVLFGNIITDAMAQRISLNQARP
jgi:hypothetical protein